MSIYQTTTLELAESNAYIQNQGKLINWKWTHSLKNYMVLLPVEEEVDAGLGKAEIKMVQLC